MNEAKISRELARVRTLRHEVTSARLAVAQGQMRRATQWREHVAQVQTQEQSQRWVRSGEAVQLWRDGMIAGAAIAVSGQEALRREAALNKHYERALSQEQASRRLLEEARKESALTARGCERADALRDHVRQLALKDEAVAEMLTDEETTLGRSSSVSGGAR